MEWFSELYDDFRQRTGFGNIPAERTAKDVDFIIAVCGMKPGDRVLDACAGTGRHSIELEMRGIRAAGFELNPEYVALAGERAKIAGVGLSMTIDDVRSAEFGSEYLLSHFRAKTESIVDGIQVVEEREFDAATHRMRSVIIRHEESAVVVRRTDWRLYSLEELSELGRRAGLGLVAAYGDLERNPAGPHTRLMRLVLGRRE